jgi:hypothetical protein
MVFVAYEMAVCFSANTIHHQHISMHDRAVFLVIAPIAHFVAPLGAGATITSAIIAVKIPHSFPLY